MSVFDLAYSLKKRGKKVLAVDFDPQSNLTTCFGAEDVDVAVGDLMMNVLEEEDLSEKNDYIWERNGVDFIPASIGLSEQYDKTCCQGKRSDIICELEILAGDETESTCGHNGHKLKSRDVLARKYGFISEAELSDQAVQEYDGQERDSASLCGGCVLYARGRAAGTV